MSEPVLEHPSIGLIRGIAKSPAVPQYLGIQFASLKDRFARGELLLTPPADHSRRSESVLDATKNGYANSAQLAPRWLCSPVL